MGAALGSPDPHTKSVLSGARCRHLKKRAADRGVSVRHPPFGYQPGVDYLPFIAAIRSKLEQARPLILQFVKKLQRVPGGCRLWIDLLSLKPPIPFQQDQSFPFALSHKLRVPSQKGWALEGWIFRAGFSGYGLDSRPSGLKSKRRSATAVPVSAFRKQCA